MRQFHPRIATRVRLGGLLRLGRLLARPLLLLLLHERLHLRPYLCCRCHRRRRRQQPLQQHEVGMAEHVYGKVVGGSRVVLVSVKVQA